jgi:hypothetical protein
LSVKVEQQLFIFTELATSFRYSLCKSIIEPICVSCQPVSSYSRRFKPASVLKLIRLPSIVRIEPLQAGCLLGSVSVQMEMTNKVR